MLALSFPINDWQFWIATAIALAAAYAVGRMVLPKALIARLLGKKPRPPRHRATLTMDGKPVDKK